jgi:purine-binding chemotaxis protein CheW
MENPIDINAQLHLVTFQLDRQIYALPIESIQQVIEMVTITPIPQVRASVEGVINFHGTAVPVINLRQHLGMGKTPMLLHTPILMIYISKRLVGLIVDEVQAVLELTYDQVIHPGDILPEGLGDPALLKGLFYSEGYTIFLLDIDHLFAPQEATALAEVIAALPEKGKPVDEEKLEPQNLQRPKRRKKTSTEKNRDEKAITEVGSLENPG